MKTLLLFFICISICVCQVSICNWSQGSLSINRGYMGVASLRNLGFFAGGDVPTSTPGGGPQSRVDIFDHTTRQWKTHELSEARYAMVATSILSYQLVLFGGGHVENYSARATVDIYNSSADWDQKWTVANLSVARFDPVATSVGDFAFFAGGFTEPTSPYGPSGVLDIYDASNNTWSAIQLSEARGSFVAVSVGATAMFAGGRNMNGTDWGVTDAVDIYNINDKTLTHGHFLSQARYGLTGTTVVGTTSTEERLYGITAIFAGGAYRVMTDEGKVDQISAVVDLFNYELKTWTSLNLTEGRIWSTAASFYDIAYIIGGDTADASSKRIDVYNTTSGLWTQLELSQERKEISAIMVENTLLVAGYVPPISNFSNGVDFYHCPECVDNTFSPNRYSPCYSCPKGYSSEIGETTCTSERRKGSMTEMIIIFAVFLGVTLIALAIIYVIRMKKNRNNRRWQTL